MKTLRWSQSKKPALEDQETVVLQVDATLSEQLCYLNRMLFLPTQGDWRYELQISSGRAALLQRVH